MVGSGFRNQVKELNPIPGLNRARKKFFSDFLQRLTKTVQIGVTDPEARQVHFESLAFENANLEWKRYLDL